jgi:5-methylthioadenosine/S-adenosylhomocysteine deaminase
MGALLLRGGKILTLNAEATVLEGADVYIEEGRIRKVGSVGAAPPGAAVMDLGGDWVLPGLVQGHIHLGQTVFRGLAEGRRLLAWLRERIWPLEAAHDDESAYWSALLGASECLLGGTTTIQEIGIGPGARGLLEGIRDSGLRALAGPCLMDSGLGLPAGLSSTTEAALALAEELGDAFDGAEGGRLRFVLNPRFILSCSDPLWAGIRELGERRSWPIHTHALEQADEGEEVRRLKGRDEMEYFDETGILSGDLRIAHGVWLTPEHLDRARGERFSVVHCPSSNLKLGSGLADVVGIRRAGIPVGIGADGAPCSNSLDAFGEVRLAALLQQLRNGPGCLSGLEALRLATSEGARALGLDSEIGSIELGKCADLVILRGDALELFASEASDPHDRVAYGATRSAVRHVLVEGELRVQDGQLQRIDRHEVQRRTASSLARLLVRSGLELAAGPVG